MASHPSSSSLRKKSQSKLLESLAQQIRLYKPTKDAAIKDGISQNPSSSFHNRTINRIKRSAKRAAVLICLFEGDDGELRVILTKRSANLSSHSGEVSLPGGKAEEGDANDAATALRETKEEIGLDPCLVTVVAVLEPFLSKHLLRVAPVICILSKKDAFTPSINKSEVDIMFDAPLEMFLKNENRRWEDREWLGVRCIIHYFDFRAEQGDFMIWGLTAQILIRAASIVFQRQPEFEEQTPDFHVLNQREDHL